MFEKEAEEYRKEKIEERKDKYVFELPEVYVADIKQAFKDGAEFGYNKANEWLSVKDGDLPKNERWVCNQDGCYCYYDIDTEQWLDIEGTRIRTIEWCEMPKFKE